MFEEKKYIFLGDFKRSFAHCIIHVFVWHFIIDIVHLMQSMVIPKSNYHRQSDPHDYKVQYTQLTLAKI